MTDHSFNNASIILASFTKRSIRIVSLSMLAVSIVVVGCTESTSHTRSVLAESPKISSGAFVESPEEDGLLKIADALDDLNTPVVSAGVLASIQERLSKDFVPRSRSDSHEWLPESLESVQEKIDVTPSAQIQYPPESGKLISLDRYSQSEINELLSSISLRLQTEHSYKPTSEAERLLLGKYPEDVFPGPSLIRSESGDSTSYIRLGFVRYSSQLPQLWIQGVTLSPDLSPSVNTDIDLIQPYAESLLSQVQELRSALTPGDLDRKLVQLSYVDTKGAINALKGLGIQTSEQIQGLPATINFDQLPIVTTMPTPSAEQIGLIGGDSKVGQGAFGQTTTPSTAGKLNSDVYAGPSSQLLVIYHPAHPEQFSTVQAILNDYIDRPARLVFIEGLVLEISEDGLDELGVEWSYQQGAANLVLGSLDPTGLTDSLTFSNLDSRDVGFDWGVKVRALISNGKAEILSRPSVLTMNNRQASIRVGEDLPIATSQEGVLNNSNKVAFNFKYLPTGILLNIRPRVTEGGEEVSMLIDTVVSAQVPGRDLEVRSADGELLASAPTISTRRVQTYARIDNKTPFIIGGLVSRDLAVIKDKVPFLGDLPLIGPAFRSESTSITKREVIIVLTPYVLPEDQVVTRALPKDDDLFDNTGNNLFRDAYRIRGEDVFDLRFLAENKRLQIYRELAKDLINKNFELATTYPFSEFESDSIPGEEILIQRMLYEVIKRTEVDQRINPKRMIYFEEKDYEGYNVRFLDYALTQLGDGLTPESFFERNTGKAIAMTYTYSRNSMDKSQIGKEPIPQFALVDCPDRDTWQQLLWEMNKPTSSGLDQFTILIHSPADIVRLQRALMLKFMVILNGGEDSLSLTNFTIGKILHTPLMGDDKVSVIDADVARYFFHTELYYAAIIRKIEQTLVQFDEALKTPEIQLYLDSTESIPTPLNSNE